MPPAPKYRRVLLKVSGEALMGSGQFGIDVETIDRIARDVKEAADAGTQICMVVGGGNIFRGLAGSAKGIDRATADYMGMLATVINGLALMDLFPKDERLHRWLKGCRGPDGKNRFSFQGLPARICWLGYGERDRAGRLFNELVRDGEVSAPIVIGRDHLDCGSVASPNRETEAMKDGTDAVSDWALLNAMVNIASGASWVSFHHGGGVGIGYSQHAGQVIVADGTPEAAERIARVLANDPMMGVFRHADAGYEEAIRCAREHEIDVPMME